MVQYVTQSLSNNKISILKSPPWQQGGDYFTVTVPLRTLLEAIGPKLTITYDDKTRTVTAKGFGYVDLKLTLDSTYAIVKGKTVKMDVPPRIKDGRTLIPLRFFAESIDAKVNWNPELRVVIVSV
ncbi:copper amine oxidase N-terminal domain-containing protein [Heliobacterium chlorum]|uniref:Copper amine oxidase N-terminal domain-containing protein n=1 Tax=Heliobacterium chlorum TaxID=2698 RepID=A0ABR7T9C9_HELCL|nr:copper amine oxidase N-terminal domain-containing protein [Heliobacterium chlorum]